MSLQKPAPKDRDFPSILSQLLAHPAPVLPPPCVLLPSLTGDIAALSLHPTLEAALHILNHDLPSAHFLVRHMQADPAFEGMFLHGILQRVEGDYDNARAWGARSFPVSLDKNGEEIEKMIQICRAWKLELHA